MLHHALKCLGVSTLLATALVAQSGSNHHTTSSTTMQNVTVDHKRPSDIDRSSTLSPQQAANIFSWEQFIALNWPASSNKRGEPDLNKNIDDGGTRVWETWKEDYEVYLPNGQTPASWNTAQSIPSECSSSDKLLFRTTKVDDVIDQTLQALPADATSLAELKDQQGRLIRYEIRLNQTLFDYIIDQQLYNGAIQATASSITFPNGSQLLKAAWREVNATEAPYFLTTNACVCDSYPPNSSSSDCKLRTMGLAGFHLMTKTASAPQWIWSTYEQVDNTTAIHPVTPLNDPSCPPERCTPNLQTPEGVPTQLTRVIPISEETDTLNQLLQSSPLLQHSYLRHYELVSTQWPVDGAKEPEKTVFTVQPELLANTTMESFAQNTSSCMGCHVMSRTLNPTQYISADYSFTLNNAKPLPSNSQCTSEEASESCNNANLLPLPLATPKTEWEKAHWDDIQMGYRVATATYETIGAKNVGNRMHCQSCHLNGGGNPQASWWVHMEKRYPNQSGTTLQERINGCFERSMNGRPLCDGEQACDANPFMRGLTTYMEWLTRVYDATPSKQITPLPHGFPGDLTGQGNYAKGKAIYTQKCAFCHNNDGQGRYASHTYFRPALWGPHSYNACAGMAKPEMLANFLHANMPYTSGGMLTKQEANDLATYIDQQCRPGKGGVDADGNICTLAPGCVNGASVPLH